MVAKKPSGASTGVIHEIKYENLKWCIKFIDEHVFHCISPNLNEYSFVIIILIYGSIIDFAKLTFNINKFIIF